MFSNLLHRDEKLALEVKKFEKAGKKMMDSVLIDNVFLEERSGVRLR